MTKYAITDGEQCGWFAVADTLKEAVRLMGSAKDYVIAIENGEPRQLTPDEQAKVDLYRKQR